jgi:hypothetical protein
MTRDTTRRDGLSAADQRFLSLIETIGWNVTNVFKTEGDHGPEWSYSTGLFHSFGHPEVLVFGLALDNMQKIINNIGLEIRAGKRFDVGAEYFGMLANYGCRFREVDTAHYRAYLGLGDLVLSGRPFPSAAMFLARSGRSISMGAVLFRSCGGAATSAIRLNLSHS